VIASCICEEKRAAHDYRENASMLLRPHVHELSCFVRMYNELHNHASVTSRLTLAVNVMSISSLKHNARVTRSQVVYSSYIVSTRPTRLNMFDNDAFDTAEKN